MFNGMINVIKPPQMTSHDVVSWFRKRLNMKKIGHSGTLDPMATGVINVFLGQATKLISYQHHPVKKYRAEMLLGYTSDTLDGWGNVSKVDDPERLDEAVIHEAIQSFVGEIEQIPPMYSAIKINGQKMYQLARKGQIIEREPRKITIYSIDEIKIVENSITFDVVCSRGTYIRTLVDDIGEKLKTKAIMTNLIRMENENFSLQDAMTLEEIQNAIDHDDYSFILDLLKIMNFVEERFELNSSQMMSLKNGLPLQLNVKSDLCLLMHQNTLVGLAGVENGHFKIFKRFLSEV